MADRYPKLDELVAFHGHLCPGLAIGYRSALAGLERLGVTRASDEELVTIVENDSCSVDAVQYLAGCTFGKGNLFFRDWGKQVFTFVRRGGGDCVRVGLKWGALEELPAPETASADEQRQAKTDFILGASLEELFDIRDLELDLPAPARIHKSLRCDNCGEPVMETRTVARDNRTLCHDCARQMGE